MRSTLGISALFLTVPILLSGCGANASAIPNPDYDKVSLIEYQECLARFSTILSNQAKGVNGEPKDLPNLFQEWVQKPCKELKPIKE